MPDDFDRPLEIIGLYEILSGELMQSFYNTWQFIKELFSKSVISVTISFNVPSAHIMPGEKSHAFF